MAIGGLVHYNVEATWQAPALPVSGYNIYHAKKGEPLKLFAGTAQEITILYPAQMGYVDGDEMDVAISGKNPTGEGPLSDRQTILLPVQMPLPEKIMGLTLRLVLA